MSGKNKRGSAASVTPKSHETQERERSEASDSSTEEYPTFQSWAPDQLEVQILEDNSYHKLELMDWWRFSPVAIKGIISVVQQMDVDVLDDLKYCQIAVSTSKKPTEATVRQLLLLYFIPFFLHNDQEDSV